MQSQWIEMINELNPIIGRIPAWASAKHVQVERIAGLTNTNYRVTVNGECFVLRVSGKNTGRLGINRQHEAAALKTAAALGLGPEVFAFLLPEGHLVTRWVEGWHWDPAEFRTPEHVRLLTQTVKLLHAMPPNGAVFSPFRRVEAYIEAARGFAIPFPPGFVGFIETMYAIEADQQTRPVRLAALLPQRSGVGKLPVLSGRPGDQNPRLGIRWSGRHLL